MLRARFFLMITFELKKIGTSSLRHIKAKFLGFKMQQTYKPLFLQKNKQKKNIKVFYISMFLALIGFTDKLVVVFGKLKPSVLAKIQLLNLCYLV